jgi:hypothetical protein
MKDEADLLVALCLSFQRKRTPLRSSNDFNAWLAMESPMSFCQKLLQKVACFLVVVLGSATMALESSERDSFNSPILR